MYSCLFLFFIGFLFLIAIGTIYHRFRIQRIARSRSSETFNNFKSSFSENQIPEEILLAVYTRFQEWEADIVDDFPVRAEDNIGKIYGMVHEDLEDTLIKVLNGCNRQLPPHNQLYYTNQISTIKDFVLFIASCPKSKS